MARLDIPVTTMPLKYPALQPAVNTLDVTWTAAGASFALGAQFPLTGREIVLCRNPSGGALTVTVTSIRNEYNRLGDITAYSIGAGETAVLPQFQLNGWKQSDGMLYLEASAADILFAVLKLTD